MILNKIRKWLLITFIWLPIVNLQIAMQVMQMPAQMYGYAPPPPMPVAVPFAAPSPIAFQIVEIQETKTTTTTTTEKANTKEERTIGIAIPMGYPTPVQFAVPAYPPPSFCLKKPRPNNCPVCPPCMCNPCTPAFFSYCSPCHQKCRCRNSEDAPIPLPHDAPDPVVGPAFPMPMPIMASQSIMIPVHHKGARRALTRTRRNYDKSDESSDTSGLYSAEWRRRRRRHRRKNTGRSKNFMYRRAYDFHSSYEDDFAKPVLSYLSNDGSVKIEKPLSHDEAVELMGESKVSQKVQVFTEEDIDNRQRLKVITDVEKISEPRKGSVVKSRDEFSGVHRNRQIYVKPGLAQHVLAEGKKELVFKPPSDKKISNLSVSFQIV